MNSKNISLRIDGHAKIDINLDDNGKVLNELKNC